MELETFVTESILGIMRGVNKAQSQANQKGVHLGRVYPRLRQVVVAAESAGVLPPNASPQLEWSVEPEMAKSAGMLLTKDGDVADVISFDVAVTVQSSESSTSSQDTGAKGGVGIKVLEMGLDSTRTKLDGESSARSHETRLKFRIPICFAKTG